MVYVMRTVGPEATQEPLAAFDRNVENVFSELTLTVLLE